MTDNLNDSERQFQKELLDLLDKWGVELIAEDHTRGYTDGGCDYHIEASGYAKYNTENKVIQESIDIDLGGAIFPRR